MTSRRAPVQPGRLSSSWARRRRSDAGTEAGFTLIEMLIAMLVFTIFAAMVLGIYVNLVTQQTSSNDRFANTGEGQVIMDRLTSDLRAAVYCACGSTPASPLSSATATSITFYAAIGGGPGPTEVTFNLSGDQLTETDTPATGGASPYWTFGQPKTAILSPSIANSTSNPLFTYYNSGGTELASPMTTTAQTVAVEMVCVNLVVNSNKDPGSAATLDNCVHLLNVDYANGS
jgi:prepilin-type N-terminal cleavage/methylation domain-containing protein